MIKKILLYLIAAAFIVLLAVINIKQQRTLEDLPTIAIPENQLLMEDIFLVRMMDSNGGYITLRADSAYYDRDNDIVTLLGPDVVLKDDQNDLITSSDRGIYVLNQYLSTYGNIHGIWNELEYTVAPDGTFDFDFTTDMGVAKESVTFTHDTSYITSREFHYNGQLQTATFIGDVEMTFTGEDIQ